MKKCIQQIILIVLLILVFMMIFGFSNQNGEESGSLSGEITNIIIKIFNIKFSESEISLLEHIIRKLAHFSIYTLLGILLVLLFNTYNLKKSKKVLFSVLIGTIYAITDEIHQSFIPDRSPQITDVMIDTLGVIFGIIIAIFIIKVINKYRSIKYKKEI